MLIETFLDTYSSNYNQADCDLIVRAYRMAEDAHEGQTRALEANPISITAWQLRRY